MYQLPKYPYSYLSQALEFYLGVCFLCQFVIFKPLGYCFEEIIGFDVKASFARRPVSRLVKPGDIIKV